MKNYYITESGDKNEIFDSISINLSYDNIVEVVIVDLPMCMNLRLDNNNINSVSIDIPNCKYLCLQHNNLKSVEFDLPECIDFNINNNKLESVSLNLPKCETLRLNNNKLKSVELNLPKCKILRLDDNRLESVDLSLPECLRLDLDGNKLKSVDLSLPECEILYLSSNALESIDLYSPRCFRFYLYNNKLKSVEINLPKLSYLRSDLIKLVQTNGDIVMGFDSIPIIVDSEKKLGEFTIYSGRYKIDSNKIFVASRGKYFAHGDTMKKAIEDCNFKFLQKTVDVTSHFAECKEKGVMSVSDYRLLTGACESGCKHFLKSKGVECKEMKFDDAMNLLEESKPYGWGKIKELI